MLKTRFRLDGRVAVVTGAGTGLGRSIAETLAQCGANIVLTGRRNDVLEDAAEAIRRHNVKVMVRAADVTCADQVENLMSATAEEFGQIDILVNNAGALLHVEVPFEDLPYDKWHEAMDANLTSVFLCAQAAGRRMLPRNVGSIVSISSVAAIAGAPLPTYGPGKAAVIQLTRVLAMLWARNNIRVNCIVAGTFATQMATNAGKTEFIPIGRAGDPSDIGHLAAFLVSDAADYLTGNDFVIDGGVLADRWAPVDYVP